MSAAASRSDASSSGNPVTKDSAKHIWCETQWTTLSCQAKALGLPTLPYFNPKTMLLSKEVNQKLWRQLGRLYSTLGPEHAPYATPVMIEGGEVEWHSYMDGSKGEKADIFEPEK